MPPSTSPVRCRQIAENDIEAVKHLLTRHFPRRDMSYWTRAFERLSARTTISDAPRYGYMLEADGAPVGVLLLIFASIGEGDATHIRCNLSSWCVDDAYATYAPLLVSIASRKRDSVTFTNISAAQHTTALINNYHFKCYSRGQYVGLPWLCASRANVIVSDFSATSGLDGLPAYESRLLSDHMSYGWTALTCRDGAETYPFAFIPRTKQIGPVTIPYGQLGYCRAPEDFIRFAGPIGRKLAKRGWLFVLLDANGTLPGLPGRYIEARAPKYFRGLHPPALGDLSYSEAAFVGFD